ncbi:hypothetical protein GCM10027203_22970 [Nonomuraea fastidiosa]
MSLKAVAEGGGSFFASGVDPGWANDVLEAADEGGKPSAFQRPGRSPRRRARRPNKPTGPSCARRRGAHLGWAPPSTLSTWFVR